MASNTPQPNSQPAEPTTSQTNQPPPAYELFDETTATLSIIQDGFNTQTHVRSMPSAILSNL